MKPDRTVRAGVWVLLYPAMGQVEGIPVLLRIPLEELMISNQETLMKHWKWRR